MGLNGLWERTKKVNDVSACGREERGITEGADCRQGIAKKGKAKLNLSGGREGLGGVVTGLMEGMGLEKERRGRLDFAKLCGEKACE